MAVRRGGSGDDVIDAGAFDEFDESNDYSGLAGDDTLTGGGLKDTLVGGRGSDRLFGDDGSDILLDTNRVGDDLLEGDAGDDTIEARYGADTLSGGAGDDSITFGFGAMLVRGGRSDDLFYSIGDAASVATVLGGSGDDVLHAGASSDVLNGGQGQDLVDYSATASGVVVNLATGATGGGAAGDTFRFVEDVIGTSQSDVILGDGAYNVLLGGAGDDTVGGDFGGDFLNGGGGFDVADLAGGSTGVVADLAAGTFGGGGADGDTLLNFEGLAGSDFADALNGDTSANLLLGRAGADTLNGAEGADTMVGGLGSDLYRVDDLGDSLVEEASGGVDTVETTIDFSLAGAADVENLTLVGPGALSGTGNGLANLITGNEFRNVIDGGAGADTMAGGLRGDSYYVDSAGDRVVEDFGSGFDEIFASVSLDLLVQATGSSIEKVTLTGDADIDFSSSHTFAGEVIGNDGDNRFTIFSGLGATFTGGAGADRFYFTASARYLNSEPSVTDFVKGEDIVELPASVDLGLPAGPLDPDAFHLGLEAADEEDRVLYSEELGKFYTDRDGSDTRYDPILIGSFEPGLALRADDFVLV